MDCVYIDFIFKTVSNSECLHVNLKVSLNNGDSRVPLVRKRLIYC